MNSRSPDSPSEVGADGASLFFGSFVVMRTPPRSPLPSSSLLSRRRDRRLLRTEYSALFASNENHRGSSRGSQTHRGFDRGSVSGLFMYPARSPRCLASQASKHGSSQDH